MENVNSEDLSYSVESNQNSVVRPKKYMYKHTLTPEHLISGFGPHTHRSLELAIKTARGPQHLCKCTKCHIDKLEPTVCEESSFRSESSQTLSTFSTDDSRRKAGVHYLMGLKEPSEEEAESVLGEYEPPEDYENLINGSSEAMRKAQLYLRQHRIFEFFQFLIAHLLAASPIDPICFLINLLDKCLIYRAGICDPPLLYDRPHIECLFNLMDRMRTGYIDQDQYKTGMYTLGIKSFNPRPPATAEQLVPKHFFLDEAYECLTDLLNDMLKKRKIDKKLRLPKAPPPSIIRSTDLAK